jgi:hypothetical protein
MREKTFELLLSMDNFSDIELSFESKINKIIRGKHCPF